MLSAASGISNTDQFERLLEKGEADHRLYYMFLPGSALKEDKLQSLLHFSGLELGRKNHFSIRKSRTAPQILEKLSPAQMNA